MSKLFPERPFQSIVQIRLVFDEIYSLGGMGRVP